MARTRLMKGRLLSKIGMLSLFGALAMLTLATGYASAQQQNIALSASASPIGIGDQVTITVGYDVSDGDNTLSGIGVRVHYDSTSFTYDSNNQIVPIVAPSTINNPGDEQDDAADDDGDGSTDKYVGITYIDFGGNFPNVALPTNLVELTFTATKAAANAAFNVSFASTDPSYTGAGTNTNVTVNAAPVDPANSSLTFVPPGPNPADGATAFTFIITSRDASSNTIEGSNVTLALEGGATGPTITQPATATNAAGETTGTMTSTVAGTFTVSATIDGIKINQTQDVEFVAGAADKVALDASKTVITTDGVDAVTLTATLQDANGNTVTGDTRDVTITLSDATYANLDAGTKPFDGGTGTATFTLTSTGTEAPEPPGTADFTATASSAGLTDSAPKTITAQNDVLLSIAISPTSATAKVGGATAQFTATGNYQTQGAVDITEQVDWTVTAGTGDGTITDGVGGGLFTGTAAGNATVAAELGGVNSNTANVTIQPPDALVFDCNKFPTARLGDAIDLANAVSGGIPPYAFTVLTTPTGAGNPLAGSVFQVVDNTPFAGTYSVEVQDATPGTPQTKTCNITVPLAVDQSTLSVKECGPTTVANFTVKGAPTGTTFTATGVSSGTVVVNAADASGNAAGTFTAPAKDPLITATENFPVTITAADGALSGQSVKTQNQMVACCDFTGNVTDGAAAIDGVKVTSLLDAAQTDNTDATGAFTIPDIDVTGADLQFSFEKTGFVSRIETVTNVCTALDVVMTALPCAGTCATISGTISLSDGKPVGTAQVTLMADGQQVVIGADPLLVFPDPTTGAYTIDVPDADAGATQYTVMAAKNGYISNSVTVGGPLNLANVNVGMSPYAFIAVQGFQAGGDLVVLVDGAAGPDGFNGTAGEFAFTGDGVQDFPGGGNYTVTVGAYDTNPLTWTFNADITDDRDVTTNPTFPHMVTRGWCYVDGQSDAYKVEIDTPSANGGAVTTVRNVTVTLPPGGLIGTALERVVLYVVDAVPADAYGTTPVDSQLIGGPIMVEAVIIGPEGHAIPDADIGQVIIKMPYDTTTISSDDLLTGAVPIYKAEGPAPDGQSLQTRSLCDMIAGTGVVAVNPADIIDASGGYVTFQVNSLSAFGIGKAGGLAAPQLTSLTPSSGLATAGGATITVSGTGLNTVTQLLVGGTDTAFTPISDTQLSFIAPAGSANSTKTVQARNAAGLSNTLSFAYIKDGPIIPPPIVYPPPVVNFEVEGFEDAEVIEIQVGTELEFTDLSTGAGLYDWLWSFNYDDPEAGDAFESRVQNPVFTYEEPGTYTVRLRVYGLGGQGSKTIESFIVVSAAGDLNASFTVAPDVTGQAPFTVTLTDTSTGTVESRQWFVDGTGIGATSPLQYTFQQAGSYTVRLAVSGPAGDDDASRTVTVTGGGTALTANFTFAVDGLTANFTDTSTPAEMILFRLWDFGDGVTEEGTNPSHTYIGAGTYTVSLTVVDQNQNEASVSKSVTVTPASGQINAAFTADPTSGNVPLTVQFTDQSTATGQITSWSWAFGDGGTSNAPSPTYVYDVAGTYTASLTVMSADGSDTATRSIIVRTVGDPGDVVDPPSIVFPMNGEDDVPTKPTFTVGEYNDGSNAYGYTEWQIALDPGFAQSDIVWTETTTDFSFTVPDMVLNAGMTQYYLRVRFVDANGLASAWSGPIAFTTVQTDEDDLDGNGVPDDQEVDDPSVNFPGLAPGALIKFARNGDLQIALEGMDFVDAVQYLMFVDDIVCDGSGACTFPAGWIGFKVHMNAVGAIVKVKLRFSSDLPEGISWYQHSTKKGCVSFDDAVEQLDARTVVISITDGGDGDADDLENGIVIDPISYCVIPPTGGDSGGGSDTCFIGTVGATGGLGIASFAAIAAMLSGALAIRARRK